MEKEFKILNKLLDKSILNTFERDALTDLLFYYNELEGEFSSSMEIMTKQDLQIKKLKKKIETLEEEKLLLQSRFKDNGKHIPRID